MAIVACFGISGCSIVSKFNKTQQFENQIYQTILKHPEWFKEWSESYNRFEYFEKPKILATKYSNLKSSIIKDNSLWDGSDKKENLLIEFYNYQCPGCFQVLSEINSLLKQYGDRLTVLYQPCVIPGSESIEAPQAAWAAKQQNKFSEYHNALFKKNRNLNEETYITIAKQETPRRWLKQLKRAQNR